MEIAGSVAFVTGANRGIGREWVTQLQARGAAKIYAAARSVDSITASGVEAIPLDVTDPAQVSAAAQRASDVALLINNAGVSTGSDPVTGDLGNIRSEFETNVFGPLLLTRAFAPVLATNGGGAIINVLSALSWFTFPGSATYSASKAAAWSLTDGFRIELAGQGTQVLGVHMGLVDTDMAAGMDWPKITPAEVVNAALDSLEAGAAEVLVDDTARQFKASLSLDPAERYATLPA